MVQVMLSRTPWAGWLRVAGGWAWAGHRIWQLQRCCVASGLKPFRTFCAALAWVLYRWNMVKHGETWSLPWSEFCVSLIWLLCNCGGSGSRAGTAGGDLFKEFQISQWHPKTSQDLPRKQSKYGGFPKMEIKTSHHPSHEWPFLVFHYRLTHGDLGIPWWPVRNPLQPPLQLRLRLSQLWKLRNLRLANVGRCLGANTEIMSKDR